MSRVARWTAAGGALALLLMQPGVSGAYVPQTIDFVGGEPVIARWSADAFPLNFQVTPGVTDDLAAGVARAALDRAAATWSSVPSSRAAISVTRERDVEANVLDGINAIEFSNDSSLQGAGFVALTFVNTAPDGTILEADILVNDRAIGFTDDPSAGVGLDLETAMLREFGKVLGLGGSPLGTRNTDGTVTEESAVMFPVARGVGESARILTQDDVAGISALYPTASTDRGSISGTVRRADGPVFGAHVVVFDPVQQLVVGAVSLPDGSFEVGGLPPGRYFVEVLPLSSLVSPASLGGIFDSDLVDTGFRRAFHDRTLRLGAGGAISGVNVEVQ